MADDNAFARILNRISTADTGVTEKTASEVSDVTPNAAEKMVATIRSISSTVKTAATTPSKTPASDLALMAKQAHESEQAQLEKEAQYLGAAVCDGFMSRFAQYDTALADMGVKTAAAPSGPGPNNAHLQKVAEAAYSQAVQDMEKQAEEEFNKGYNDQLQAIHKVAADIHYVGQQTANAILQEARKDQ